MTARDASARVNPGRLGALRALIDVEAGGHLEERLAVHLPADPADRGLGWNLAFGVLRHRGQIDAALRPHLRQPLDELEDAVRTALRAGAYERLFARTPVHAAVDQGVEAARAVGAGRASGLVNAVLRRVEPVAELSRSEKLDHPAWLVARWDRRYGAEATDAWCLANGEAPPLNVVVKGDMDAALAAFAAADIVARPVTLRGEVVPGVLRLEGHTGRVESLPGWQAGDLWVQDVASVWMTDLVPSDARTVLDACAAPGGKTLRLAARGHQVLSVDVSEPRLARLHGSLRRTGLAAGVRVHDWTQGPLPGVGDADAVLVDAPCTGLGTVRRRPEIRWRRAPTDPRVASDAQKAIVSSASQHVRAGGALVYVVCSSEPEEGERVVEWFLREHPRFTLDVSRATAPPEDGEDAFYGARLVSA